MIMIQLIDRYPNGSALVLWFLDLRRRRRKASARNEGKAHVFIRIVFGLFFCNRKLCRVI